MSIIPNFPGIDPLLKGVDAVVVATTGRNVEKERLFVNGLFMHYECIIQQTLKGDLKPQSQVVLYLGDDSEDENAPLPFRTGTTAIFFLLKRPKDNQGAEYMTPREIGTTIPIAPRGWDAVSQSGTSKEQIKALIRHYRQYRDKQMRREDELLMKALRS